MAAAAAVAGGLLFIAVQINHPPVDLALVTTGEWVVRQSMKVAFTVLALIGITGMYLRQVTKSGSSGADRLLLILGAGFLTMFALEAVGLVVDAGDRRQRTGVRQRRAGRGDQWHCGRETSAP